MRYILSMLLACISYTSWASKQDALDWQDWQPQAFAQAAAEGKFVLLDLEAVWCHWCHVMAATTYQDPDVVALMQQHYIPVRVDQDARPDLANRYRDYGWPATIVLAADGTEIVKRAGYIAPENMARLLQAIVRDPSPERLAVQEATQNISRLPAKLRQQLEDNHFSALDYELGGLNTAQKFIDRDSVEYALTLSQQPQQQAWASQTLAQALNLSDPAWGGFYQYSTHGDWLHPHYEKLLYVQAEYLRIYSLAYAQQQDLRWQAAMRRTLGYVERFLSDEKGAFYVSQDADLVPGEHSSDYFALSDGDRVAQGLPRIDTHTYAREAGWMITALSLAYEATLDAELLARARRAADWVLTQRRNPDHSFRHDQQDVAGPYLGDQLATAQGFLHLYRTTAEKCWLTLARQGAEVIIQRFRLVDGGFSSAVADGSPLPPQPQLAEMITLSRFSNLLSHYTGDQRFQRMAEHAMRWMARESVALATVTESGILLADDELSQDPLHITVVGDKSDPAALALFQQALQLGGSYRRIEWWDKGEGPLTNMDVQYPDLDRAAAFICTQQRCSSPILAANKLAARVRQLQRTQAPPKAK